MADILTQHIDLTRRMAALSLTLVAAWTVTAVSEARTSSAPNLSPVEEKRQATQGPRDVAETAPMSGGDTASGPSSTSTPETDATSPISFSEGDRKSMRALTQAHLAEIKMAALATAISRDAAVRAYAEKMLEEHMRSLDELRQLADRGTVILPGGVDREQAAQLHELGLKTGDAFDRYYMEQAGLTGNQQVQKVFQQVADNAKAPQLQTYAASFTPSIDEHLQLARQMLANPETALNAVEATVRAGQSTPPTSGAGTSDQQNMNGAAKGTSSIAGNPAGQKK